VQHQVQRAAGTLQDQSPKDQQTTSAGPSEVHKQSQYELLLQKAQAMQMAADIKAHHSWFPVVITPSANMHISSMQLLTRPATKDSLPLHMHKGTIRH
jgi:hypothetical protein